MIKDDRSREIRQKENHETETRNDETTQHFVVRKPRFRSDIIYERIKTQKESESMKENENKSENVYEFVHYIIIRR